MIIKHMGLKNVCNNCGLAIRLIQHCKQMFSLLLSILKVLIMIVTFIELLKYYGSLYQEYQWLSTKTWVNVYFCYLSL